MKIEICKDFPTTWQVRIPKKWQMQFGLYPGRKVDIAYEEKTIYIRKEDPNSQHNKRHVTKSGYVKIPKEIIVIANITSEDEFCLYVDELKKQLVVKI